MWGDQQVYPTVIQPAFNAPPPTTTGGVTFRQQTAQMVFVAMFANPHYATMSVMEMADRAALAADALVTRL